MVLTELGWSPFFEGALTEEERQKFVPARVVEEWPGKYVLWSAGGEWEGALSGRLKNQALSRAELPCVGDWVLAVPPEGHTPQLTRVHRVLPRRTRIARMAAGPRGDEQVLACNVDYVFIVTSLNRDFNLRRLERYLALSWESGAEPVVLLSKADLCDDPEAFREQVRETARDVRAHSVSALTGAGIDDIRGYLSPGKTGVFLGSSGVGKSTLVNRLVGAEVQETGDIREDDERGRHTTTRRSLRRLPQGGMIIDTPGLREVQIRVDESSLASAFADVERLAARCRFDDCTHAREPGCAVLAAVESGELARERWDSYRKLREESRTQAKRLDRRLATNARRRSRGKDSFRSGRKRHPSEDDE